MAAMGVRILLLYSDHLDSFSIEMKEEIRKGDGVRGGEFIVAVTGSIASALLLPQPPGILQLDWCNVSEIGIPGKV
jgi:hypothetical protein